MMTVNELIEALSEVDGKTLVYVYDPEYDILCDVTGVSTDDPRAMRSHPIHKLVVVVAS